MGHVRELADHADDSRLPARALGASAQLLQNRVIRNQLFPVFWRANSCVHAVKSAGKRLSAANRTGYEVHGPASIASTCTPWCRSTDMARTRS